MWALNQRLRSATAAKALGVSRSAAACRPEKYGCTLMAVGDMPKGCGYAAPLCHWNMQMITEGSLDAKKVYWRGGFSCYLSVMIVLVLVYWACYTTTAQQRPMLET